MPKNTSEEKYREEMDDLANRLRFSRGTAEEYLRVAKYEYARGGVDGFKSASFFLEEGISHFYKDLELILYFAEILYDHGFESATIDRLEDAIEIDPQAWPAWYRLGEIYRKKMTLYRHQISAKGWSYDQYAEEYFNLAEEVFQKCRQNNYGGDSLIVNIFWLYYDTDNAGRAFRLMETYLSYPRSSAELYELAGLVSVRQKEYAQADHYYQTAFSLMTEEQRLPYAISKNYLNPRTQYLLTDQNITLEDPLRFTAYNERELEHQARVTYVQKKFSISPTMLRGWESDQGKVIIRYGFPQSEVLIHGEVEGAMINKMEKPQWQYLEGLRMNDFGYWQQRNATVDAFDTKMPVYWDFLTWNYPDFQISFEDEYNNGRFQFAEKNEFATRAKSRADISYSFLAEELFNTKPETYTLTTKGGAVPVLYEIRSNLMESNRIQLHFNYCLTPPAYKETDQLKGWEFALYRAREEINTFRKFAFWRADFRKENFWQKDSSLYGQQQFSAFSGVYEWIFEGYNKKTQEFFRYQFKDTIPDLNPRRMKMGDIQLGFFDVSKTENLATIPEIPNASHQFRQEERVVISFDVNGLDTLDQENGLLIQYKITPVEKPKSIWETLGSLFLGDEEIKLGVSISNEYPVRNRQQRIKQILDVKNLSPSGYILSVNIEELATKIKSIRTIEFKIR